MVLNKTSQIYILKPLFTQLKETIEKFKTAVKTKLNGNVVLGSRLVPLNPHDGWKWFYHPPRLL